MSAVSSPLGGNGQPFRFSGRSHPAPFGDLAARQARMETFQKVKPICVELMALSSKHPTPYSEHHKTIDRLYSCISAVPPSTLDAAVINYVLFPLTTTMRQSNPATLPDCFLEAACNLLAFVVTAWRLVDGGMDVAAWEQLWRFAVSAVGPRVVVATKVKGKGKEADQEVLLRVIRLLTALLEPSATSPGKIAHPSSSMLDRTATPDSTMLPTLFQTITILLETAIPSPPYLELQSSSLKLLSPLVTVYLAGKHPVLAAILPGTTSVMTKLINAEGKGLKGAIASQAAGIIEDVVSLTLNDADLQDLGVLRPPAEDLSQLAEEWDAVHPDETSRPSSSASHHPPQTKDPFPPLTASYLSFTATQLLSAVPPVLFTLVAHPSDLARHAAASLSVSLVEKCAASLPLLRPRALTCLLLLSQDAFDPVRHDARRRLRLFLSNDSPLLSSTLIEILSNAVNSLPRMVTSQQDGKVEELARIVTAVAQTCTELSLHQAPTPKSNAIAQLLGPEGNVERWSWALLDCLEFGKPSGWTAAGDSAERTARLGWEGGFAQGAAGLGVKLLKDGSGQGPDGDGLEKYPLLPLCHIESEATVKRMGEMLAALGSAGGQTALYSVEYFLSFAKANRRKHVAKSVSALWVAQRLLEGVRVSEVEGPEGKVGRGTRKMAREVVKAVVTMSDGDDDDEEDGDEFDYGGEDEGALLPIQRTKGVDALTTLLDRRPLHNSHTAAETRRLHIQAQKTLLSSLSLESLSLSARVLSSSFRPLLLTTLYIILSNLTSAQPIIQSYAALALAHVAYHTGYTSPSAMILDNVDYVINVVTQRLTYKRLSATAPLVLIAMIRLVGDPIVPLVQDVVDEIFDALDDYHGYETMASSLLAVLVTLIEVMSKEVEAGGPSEERLRKMRDLRRVGEAPDPAEDFAKIEEWWRSRGEKRGEVMEEILKRAPQHAWGKADIPGMEEQEGDGDEDAKMAEEPDVPPTRSQEVSTRILSKSIYFLTHSSPFLRSKILSLFSYAIPVLALGDRETELLPLVHQAWPTILNRLDDKEAYVVVEAANVIAGLCEHVGDFMSKRILDHAWPRLLQLTENQRDSDRKSALARRGAAGTESSFTVSHRLHIAILKTGTFIAREVPVADSVLWEMMLAFRPFLDARVHEELQGKAVELYNELKERDGDALWVALEATMGNKGLEDTWGYLRGGEWQLENNARRLLLDM